MTLKHAWALCPLGGEEAQATLQSRDTLKGPCIGVPMDIATLDAKRITHGKPPSPASSSITHS